MTPDEFRRRTQALVLGCLAWMIAARVRDALATAEAAVVMPEYARDVVFDVFRSLGLDVAAATPSPASH